MVLGNFWPGGCVHSWDKKWLIQVATNEFLFWLFLIPWISITKSESLGDQYLKQLIFQLCFWEAGIYSNR